MENFIFCAVWYDSASKNLMNINYEFYIIFFDTLGWTHIPLATHFFHKADIAFYPFTDAVHNRYSAKIHKKYLWKSPILVKLQAYNSRRLLVIKSLYTGKLPTMRGMWIENYCHMVKYKFSDGSILYMFGLNLFLQFIHISVVSSIILINMTMIKPGSCDSHVSYFI